MSNPAVNTPVINESSKQQVLVCKHLVKTFVEGEYKVEVLKDCNLTVVAGECIAIIGSSGSGKSTLLHLLGGLDQATSGSVQIMGKDIANLSQKAIGRLRNESLGFVYQFHHLLPEFTALENVAMPLLIRGLDVAEIEHIVVELLTKVGLASRLRHKPGELSGGERQRVAFARALVAKPQCILADEPTGNLDPRTAHNVFEVMLDLNAQFGTSLIMVTHDPELAKRMGKVYSLVDGRLV